MLNSFKVFTAFLALVSNLDLTFAAPDLTGARWIWTPGPAADGTTYPVGNVSLRRDYFPPSGKTPLSANIIITADNAYTLYVNGRIIGAQANFHQAYRYCVALETGCNVFAVEGENVPTGVASNVGNAAGVVAAIEVRYTDGFTETIITDGDWHAVVGAVPGFQEVAFDDSAWPAAFVQGPCCTTAPWTSIAIPPPTSNPGPDLTSASWIWTNELPSPGGNVPAGNRAFRKTVSLPNGQLADSIVIDITADNEYTLYINGALVGSNTAAQFHAAQRYEVNFIPSNTVTIAVFATNTLPGPAALLAAAEIRGCACGCGTNAFVVSDNSWLFSIATPAAFINPGLDDSAWARAVEEGGIGAAPWAPVTLPSSNSPPSAANPGAPAAPAADVVS